MKETLYVYTRVSTGNQVEKYSLTAQKNEGIRKANELKMDYKLFEELGKSANKEDLENRPEMTKLVNLITEGKVKHLFVTEMDRLSRNEASQYLIKKLLIDNNVTLYTTSKKYDFNDAEDEFFGSLLSLLARHENKLKSKRSIRGKLEAVKRGKHHGGMTPFGYTTDKDKTLIINQTEAELYKKMVNWSFNGIGCHKIADKLNEEGIKPKLSSYVKKDLTKKRGVTKEIVKVHKSEMIWRGTSVYKILRNTIYKGERRYKDEIVQAPQIITSELWQKLQDNLKANYNGAIRNMHVNKFLLHGLILCNRCGNAFWGRQAQSRYKKKDGSYSEYKKRLLYTCSCKDMHLGVRCQVRSINKGLLEELVWKNVTGILINSKLIREKLKELVSKHEQEKCKLTKELKNSLRKFKELTEQQERIITVFSKGIISEQNMEKQNKRIASESSEIQNRINLLKEKIALIESNSIPDSFMKAISKKVSEIKSTSDFEFKKRFIRTWVKYIHIDYLPDIKEHVIEITLKYPLFFDKEDTMTVLSNGFDIDELSSPEDNSLSIAYTSS